MTTEEVKKWLEIESQKQNILAQSYLSLLRDAAPELREHWFSQLGNILEVAAEIKRHADEVKK